MREIVGAALALAGCANASDPAAESSDATETDASSSAAEGGNVDPSGSPTDGGGDGPRFDLGSGGDPSTTSASTDASSTDDGSVGDGCSAIDVLFVIDNTEAMSSPQVSLVDALAGFVDALHEWTPADASFRYMVVDTDAQDRCTAADCANPSEIIAKLCVQPGGGYACNGHFDACDDTLGAGVVNPAGAFATNQECDVIGPKRYLDSEDADPAASLACMGHVGIAGTEHARPMDALQAALSQDQLAPAGCNAGFLREDSLLVVVFISNDPCAADSGKPQEWYASLAETVGDPQDIVVVGFVPGIDGCTIVGNEPPGCGGADQVVEGAHWAEFVGLWEEHGVLADVCDQSAYPDVLSQVAEVVGMACAGIEVT
jgi:hypothetical protein